MPETTQPNDDTGQENVFSFPFEVPDNLGTLTGDQLQSLIGQIQEHSAAYFGVADHELTDDVVAGATAYGQLAERVHAVIESRAQANTQASAASDAISRLASAQTTFSTPAPQASAEADTDTGDAGTDGTEGAEGADGGDAAGESAPAAVTAARASGTPRVRDVARGTRAPQLPQGVESEHWAVMSASADVPGFTSGQKLASFGEAAGALTARLNQYPTMTAGRAKQVGNRRPITTHDADAPGRKLIMRNYTRHGAVQFRRQFPEDLRVLDGQDGYKIAEYAAKETRLSGGNLVKTGQMRVKQGRSITAAAAWCAASEVIYRLCELESMDGLLSSPEMQTSRGGWQIPQDGGPDFASIFDSIGNAGSTHLSEADVQNDVAKVCTEIPCPEFEDVRLGVDYVCLTGGLLQRRGYPEIVARFSRGAMIALAHKMNQGFIADIVAASGAAISIPQVTTGDDAASSLLSAVELAITDIKYRNRMTFSSTLEVVMPMWFLAQIRAALARRRGILALDVTDSMIMDWFAIRDAMPQFVYDWQDAFSGQADGPGGAMALEALPTTGQFLVYPSGTWVRAVQDVVSLDTIYDSTNLETNQYTAIFAEDGWAALQMCPDSRLYEVTLDPSGVVGCCPPELIGSP